MSELPPIHVFRPVFQVEECLAELRSCLEKGWVGLGWKTLEIEEAWKAYTGLPHAHFVSSGTAALQVALRTLRIHRDWQEGDEILTTPLTFVSTNQVIVEEGLVPVFCDVDKYLCLPPLALGACASRKTRAVLFVGLGGQTGQLPAIARFCREMGLTLILDAAHLAGAKIDGRHVGHEADVACFSFHAVKNLATGDSGMVCFADEALDALARRISWHGIDRNTWARTLAPATGYQWKYSVTHPGLKANGNSLQAALALVGLRHLDRENARRLAIHERYRKGLFSVPTPGLEDVPVPESCTPSGHMMRILSERRDDLIRYLNQQAIYPGVHYELSTTHPVFRPYWRSCPNAERAAARLVTLPCHLGMTDDDVDRVAREVLFFQQGVSGP